MSTPLPSEKLDRALGLTECVALNMNAMVGIGPFIVIPLVIQAMGGPQCLLAWFAGAVLSLLDGLVWAELGAAMPRAGGTYAFLREAYGPGRGGRLMSFLYIWQTLIRARSASRNISRIWFRSASTNRRQFPPRSLFS